MSKPMTEADFLLREERERSGNLRMVIDDLRDKLRAQKEEYEREVATLFDLIQILAREPSPA